MTPEEAARLARFALEVYSMGEIDWELAREPISNPEFDRETQTAVLEDLALLTKYEDVVMTVGLAEDAIERAIGSLILYAQEAREREGK